MFTGAQNVWCSRHFGTWTWKIWYCFICESFQSNGRDQKSLLLWWLWILHLNPFVMNSKHLWLLWMKCIQQASQPSITCFVFMLSNTAKWLIRLWNWQVNKHWKVPIKFGQKLFKDFGSIQTIHFFCLKSWEPLKHSSQKIFRYQYIIRICVNRCSTI